MEFFLCGFIFLIKLWFIVFYMFGMWINDIKCFFSSVRENIINIISYIRNIVLIEIMCFFG